MKTMKMWESYQINKESLENDKMEFSGLATEHGKTTRNGSVYYKETFDIKNTGIKPALFNHDVNNVLGNVEFFEGKKGVEFKIRLNPNLEEAKEKWEMIKHGDLTGVSIGSIIEEYEYDDDYIFHAKKGTLEELSLVTIPSANGARLTNYEKLTEEKQEQINKKKKEAKNMNLLELVEAIAAKTKKKNEAQKTLDNLTKKVNEANDPDEAKNLLAEKVAQKDVIDELEKDLEELETQRTVKEANLAALKQKNEDLNKVEGKEKKMKNKKASVINVTNEALQKHLESEKGKKAFYDAVKEAVITDNDFVKGFKANLSKEGFDGDVDKLMPTWVDNEIQDKMIKKGRLLPFLDIKVGVTNWTTIYNESEELGHGHKAGDDKIEQNNILSSIEIFSQYIYKYLPVDREMLDQPSNILYNYIIDELTTRLILTIEKAVLVDDGLSDGKVGKITKIKPMAKHADDDFISSKDIAAISISYFDDLNEEINEEIMGDIIHVMHPKTFTTIKNTVNGIGNRIFEASTVTIAGNKYETLDGNIIIKHPAMPVFDQTNVGEVFTIGFKDKGYTLLSKESSADLLENFLLKQNKHEFLIEQRVGGDLTKLKSAVKGLVAAAPAEDSFSYEDVPETEELKKELEETKKELKKATSNQELKKAQKELEETQKQIEEAKKELEETQTTPKGE